MTQLELDTLVEMWVKCTEIGLGDYSLMAFPRNNFGSSPILICHKTKILDLPFGFIRESYTPKERMNVVFELLGQIYKNGDEWLQQEKDYHADKLAERWDDNRKNDLES